MAKKTSENKKGKLYLIPVDLGSEDLSAVLPNTISNKISSIDHYIAENEKTARRFIKKINPSKPQPSLQFSIINKHTEPQELPSFLNPCDKGIDMGLMSEAGCPGIADPGAKIISLAHQKNIRVIPLVGPSSITLSMMASGLNGQNFAFNGYLPIDKHERKNTLKELERLSLEKNQAQIFIETPYRNDKLFEALKKSLHPHTKLCIAREITTQNEYIKTLSIKEWKKNIVDLHKKPTIFIIQKMPF